MNNMENQTQEVQNNETQTMPIDSTASSVSVPIDQPSLQQDQVENNSADVESMKIVKEKANEKANQLGAALGADASTTVIQSFEFQLAKVEAEKIALANAEKERLAKLEDLELQKKQLEIDKEKLKIEQKSKKIKHEPVNNIEPEKTPLDINSVLDDGETIVWQGKPKKKAFLWLMYTDFWDELFWIVVFFAITVSIGFIVLDGFVKWLYFGGVLGLFVVAYIFVNVFFFKEGVKRFDLIQYVITTKRVFSIKKDSLSASDYIYYDKIDKIYKSRSWLFWSVGSVYLKRKIDLNSTLEESKNRNIRIDYIKEYSAVFYTIKNAMKGNPVEFVSNNKVEKQNLSTDNQSESVNNTGENNNSSENTLDQSADTSESVNKLNNDQ